jgi:hypothetical protein
MIQPYLRHAQTFLFHNMKTTKTLFCIEIKLLQHQFIYFSILLFLYIFMLNMTKCLQFNSTDKASKKAVLSFGVKLQFRFKDDKEKLFDSSFRLKIYSPKVLTSSRNIFFIN